MDSSDALFVVNRLVCANCGHEIEEEEFAEQKADLKAGLGMEAPVEKLLQLGLLRCLDCGAANVHQIETDLRDDLLRAAQTAGATARLVVERRPELREQVEQELGEARRLVGSLRLGTYAGEPRL